MKAYFPFLFTVTGRFVLFGLALVVIAQVVALPFEIQGAVRRHLSSETAPIAIFMLENLGGEGAVEFRKGAKSAPEEHSDSQNTNGNKPQEILSLFCNELEYEDRGKDSDQVIATGSLFFENCENRKVTKSYDFTDRRLWTFMQIGFEQLWIGYRGILEFKYLPVSSKNITFSKSDGTKRTPTKINLTVDSARLNAYLRSMFHDKFYSFLIMFFVVSLLFVLLFDIGIARRLRNLIREMVMILRGDFVSDKQNLSRVQINDFLDELSYIEQKKVEIEGQLNSAMMIYNIRHDWGKWTTDLGNTFKQQFEILKEEFKTVTDQSVSDKELESAKLRAERAIGAFENNILSSAEFVRIYSKPLWLKKRSRKNLTTIRVDQLLNDVKRLVESAAWGAAAKVSIGEVGAERSVNGGVGGEDSQGFEIEVMGQHENILCRILFELIRNACSAHSHIVKKGKAEIEISARHIRRDQTVTDALGDLILSEMDQQKSEFIAIEVADKVRRIDDNVVKTLFKWTEPKQQRSNKEGSYIGTGNGLLANRAVARRCYGDLRLRETTERGSKFWLILECPSNI